MRLDISHATVSIAPGIRYDAWTFGGMVPAPVIHVRQGQLVNVTLHNNSPMPHSIDFHAARIAPNVAFSDVALGASKTFSSRGDDEPLEVEPEWRAAQPSFRLGLSPVRRWRRVDPLLDLADELEHRDAVVARALADVEALQAEVEEIRSRSDAAGRFLAALPALTAQREGDVQAAAVVRGRAEAALRAAEQLAADAKKDAARLEAERARAAATDELDAAERALAEAEAARLALLDETDGCRAEASRLQERAAALAPYVRDVPPPPDGLEGAHEWASQARGALLLERSQLARERDAVVREASELVASVTGEAFTSTAVAGVRDRLALALARPSS